MIRAIRKKVIKLSLSVQVLLYVSITLLLTLILSVILDLNGHLTIAKAFSYLIFDFHAKAVPLSKEDRFTRWIFTVSMIFVTAVWQAIFIFRLMFSENAIRFSKVMAFYDYACLNGKNARETQPQIVFRILNDEDVPIFDVGIQAIFKYFNPGSSTIQHYMLNIRNPKKAILEAGNPFRIYIDVGLIKEAVDSKYLIYKINEQGHDGAPVEIIELLDGGDARIPDPTILVIVKSYDATLDKRSIATHEYKFNRMSVSAGRFENIRNIRECDDEKNRTWTRRNGWKDFYPGEVYAKFDDIIPCDQ